MQTYAAWLVNLQLWKLLWVAVIYLLIVRSLQHTALEANLSVNLLSKFVLRRVGWSKFLRHPSWLLWIPPIAQAWASNFFVVFIQLLLNRINDVMAVLQSGANEKKQASKGSFALVLDTACIFKCHIMIIILYKNLSVFVTLNEKYKLFSNSISKPLPIELFLIAFLQWIETEQLPTCFIVSTFQHLLFVEVLQALLANVAKDVANNCFIMYSRGHSLQLGFFSFCL